MKKIFSIALVLSVMFVACTPKLSNPMMSLDSIQKQFSTFVNATNGGDWDKVLGFSYPKLFQFQPKEQIKAMFEQSAAMGINMKIKNHKISDLSKMVKSGKEFFNKGKLTSTNVVTVTNKALLAPMKAQFKAMYKDGQIKETDNGMEITTTDDLYIINNPDDKKTYFLQSNPQLKPYINKILPSEVLDKLK